MNAQIHANGLSSQHDTSRGKQKTYISNRRDSLKRTEFAYFRVDAFVKRLYNWFIWKFEIYRDTLHTIFVVKIANKLANNFPH